MTPFIKKIIVQRG